MGVRATQLLEDWDDILDDLYGLGARNIRYVKHTGFSEKDLYGGAFVYKLQTNDKCGAEFWPSLKQCLQLPKRPFEIECEAAATILYGILRGNGIDPRAKMRLIQIDTTAHVQVVSRGKVLDPSVRLGMPVPSELKRAMYRLDFAGAVTV